MAEFEIKDGVLKYIYRETTGERIVIPDTVNEIEKLFNYYGRSASNLYIPDSVQCYRSDCFKYESFSELDLPWRKTLELAVDSHTDAVRLKLRLPEYVLNFDLSGIRSYNTMGMVLKLLRTEEFRLRYPLEVKAPIAVFLAAENKNAPAIKYLKDNTLKIARHFIEAGFDRELEILLEISAPKKVTVDILLNEAIKQDKNKVTVVLTQYKHEHFKLTENKDKFKL